MFTFCCRCKLRDVYIRIRVYFTLWNCADGHNPDGVEGNSYFTSFTVYSPPSDGSCLFATLSHQLGRGFAAVEELRSELVDYIQETATEMVHRNFVIVLVLVFDGRPESHLGLRSRVDLAPKRLESRLSHHLMTRLDLKFS